jgi:invasion protein IalB
MLFKMGKTMKFNPIKTSWETSKHGQKENKPLKPLSGRKTQSQSQYALSPERKAAARPKHFMNLMKRRAALTLIALCASVAAASEEQGVSFYHGDWEIECDNTLTCRMAGYCQEEDSGNDERKCGSVLITRAAGPNAQLEGKVTLADDYTQEEKGEPPRVLTLRIDEKSKGKTQNLQKDHFTYSLTPAQTQALLAAARKDHAIKFEGETSKRKTISFALSGNGISAVMLKMDEVQGRIGTRGALIRKGNKLEESVFAPRHAPVIRAAKASNAPPRPLTAPEMAALKPLLLRSTDDECGFNAEESEETEFTLTPLDERHVLISALCWFAAYNFGAAYWIMDSTLKGQPELVMTDATHYAAGEIVSAQKMRGLGDCRSGSNWIWDGRKFQQSSIWSSGMCRLIHAGGTWHLPTFVTEVVNEDGTPRRSESNPGMGERQ